MIACMNDINNIGVFEQQSEVLEAYHEQPKRCRRQKGDDGLTLKQRRFIEAYMGEAAGNGTMAAMKAGYKGNYETLNAIASENLRKPAIAKFIEEQTENDPLVASRIDRQRFLTAVMRDPEQPVRERLKAVELLGKMQGDFVDRQEVTAKMAVAHEHRQALDLSKLTDKQLHELEVLLLCAGASSGEDGGEPLQVETGSLCAGHRGGL